MLRLKLKFIDFNLNSIIKVLKQRSLCFLMFLMWLRICKLIFNVLDMTLFLLYNNRIATICIV